MWFADDTHDGSCSSGRISAPSHTDLSTVNWVSNVMCLRSGRSSIRRECPPQTWVDSCPPLTVRYNGPAPGKICMCVREKAEVLDVK